MLSNWLERTVQLFLLDKGGMEVKLVNYNVHGIMVEHVKGRDFVPYSSVLLMRLRNEEKEEKKPGRPFFEFSDEAEKEDPNA